MIELAVDMVLEDVTELYVYMFILILLSMKSNSIPFIYNIFNLHYLPHFAAIMQVPRLSFQRFS